MTANDVTVTPFLIIVPQRTSMDCGVACLASLFCVSYEKALLASHVDVLEKGMKTRQIQDAARRLGYTLRLKRTVDLENDVGLMAVRSTRWKHDHLVVLKEGMVADTDATVWDVDVFLAAYEATVLSILR